MLICGIDDSEGARAAARVGRSFAARLSEPLLLVHVAAPPVAAGASGVPHAQFELRELALEDGYRLLRRTASEEECTGAELRVELGDPADRLSALAEEHEATALVVGTRGRSAVRAVILGSVSLRLSRRAPCPILLVPPRARTAAVRRDPADRTAVHR